MLTLATGTGGIKESLFQRSLRSRAKLSDDLACSGLALQNKNKTNTQKKKKWFLSLGEAKEKLILKAVKQAAVGDCLTYADSERPEGSVCFTVMWPVVSLRYRVPATQQTHLNLGVEGSHTVFNRKMT